MSSSKNIDLYRDFAAGVYVFYLSEAKTQTPFHTVYVHTKLQRFLNLRCWSMGGET